MSNHLIVKRPADSSAESYLVNTSGVYTWTATRASGTTYSSREAALPDAAVQREALGQGALLAIQDQVAGTIYPVPALHAFLVAPTLAVGPSPAAVAVGGTLALSVVQYYSDPSLAPADVTAWCSFSSATPAKVTVSAAGVLTGVASGSSVITATRPGLSGTTTATAS
jgi:hypothetical protein